MHETNIEVSRDEALRLLSSHIDIIQTMQASNLLSDQESGQTFSTERAWHRIEELQGEQRKLENLEMVVAVIGTMKAGKSTTINAIVGTEIVPSRSHPMTALPTMIRHRPGQKIPRLTFQNTGPLIALTEVLAERLTNPPHSTEYRDFVAVPDGSRLVEDIRSGRFSSMDTLAEGAEAISHLLKRVNDVVRLSRVVGVPFPYHEYDEVHELPVIEVEFFHLPEEGGSGQFTLLDTPGPNEAGHSAALKESLRKQLHRSSAILVVMDFTQLNSEADEEIRKELAQVLGGSQDPSRVYVIVNKFDQKTRNDTVSADDLKRQLAQRLSSSVNGRMVTLSPAQIFLVSSQQAFLANRALSAIAQGNMGAAETQPWLDDFAVLAYGAAWDEEDLQDREETARRAESLFRKSGFRAPLDSVVRHGHRFAALNSLKSAVSKLQNNADEVGNFVNARDVGLRKQADELQCDVEALENDVRQVGNLEAELDRQLAAEMAVLKASCHALFQESCARLREGVMEIFQHESEVEAERQKDMVNTSNILLLMKDIAKDFVQQILPIDSGRQSVKDKISLGTNIGKGVIKFSKKEGAVALIEAVRTEVENEVNSSREGFILQVDEAKAKYTIQAEQTVNQRSAFLFHAVSSRLKDAGYESIKLTLPEMESITIEGASAVSISYNIEGKSEKVKQKQSGAWGWFKRGIDIFGGDWGYDETDREYYPVDFKKLAQISGDSIQNYMNGVNSTIDSYISGEIEEKQRIFFSEMKRKLEQIRGDLKESQNDKRKSQDHQQQVIRLLMTLKKNLEHESDALKTMDLCLGDLLENAGAMA